MSFSGSGSNVCSHPSGGRRGSIMCGVSRGKEVSIRVRKDEVVEIVSDTGGGLGRP